MSLNDGIIEGVNVSNGDGEVTEIYTDEGHPLMLVLFPIIDAKEREFIAAENSDNPQFQLLSLLNGANHSYFNESQFDKVNGVVEFVSLEGMKF